MTARLPSVGGDQDNWGTLLNQFLEVSLNDDGTIKTFAVNIPYASTVTPNADTTRIANIGTLTGDILIANPTGTPADGQLLSFRFIQDSIGSHNVTWGNNYLFQAAASSYLVSTANAQWEVDFRWNAGASGWQAISPVVNNGPLTTYTASTYTAALALATGTAPFLVFVAASSQFNNAATMYIYDGINTGHLNQIASVLI